MVWNQSGRENSLTVSSTSPYQFYFPLQKVEVLTSTLMHASPLNRLSV